MLRFSNPNKVTYSSSLPCIIAVSASVLFSANSFDANIRNMLYTHLTVVLGLELVVVVLNI